MLDEDENAELSERHVTGSQLSLSEMFFVTTLTAIAIWLYVYVSPVVAWLAGGSILFVAIMRQLGKRPVFIGGLAGFALAAILSWGICLLGQVDFGLTIAVVLVVPSIGYIIGAFMTELADDGSL